MISDSLNMASMFQAGIRIEYVPKDSPEDNICDYLLSAIVVEKQLRNCTQSKMFEKI
jgi:hypothetical protein